MLVPPAPVGVAKVVGGFGEVLSSSNQENPWCSVVGGFDSLSSSSQRLKLLMVFLKWWFRMSLLLRTHLYEVVICSVISLEMHLMWV